MKTFYLLNFQNSEFFDPDKKYKILHKSNCSSNNLTCLKPSYYGICQTWFEHFHNWVAYNCETLQSGDNIIHALPFTQYGTDAYLFHIQCRGGWYISRPKQNGWHIADISKCILKKNACILIKILLELDPKDRVYIPNGLQAMSWKNDYQD